MGPGGFFPTNPDLADILGDTDFDFVNFFFFIIFLGPKFLAWAQLGPTHLGPAWAHPLEPLGWAGGPLGGVPISLMAMFLKIVSAFWLYFTTLYKGFHEAS